MIELRDRRGELITTIPDDKFPISLYTGKSFFKKLYTLVITRAKKLQLK